MTIIVSDSTPTTASDIIRRALRAIGVLASGESPDASMTTDALDSLNDLLSAWSIEKLMVFGLESEAFTLTPGQSAYTMGPTGDFDTARPTTIESAFVRDGGVDYVCSIITQGQYDGASVKTTQTDIPRALYVAAGFPLTTLNLYPAPGSAVDLHITSRKVLDALPSLTTALALPPGYERALRFNLAVELMPEYGVMNPLIVQQAGITKAWVKRANYRPRIMSLPDGIPQGCR